MGSSWQGVDARIEVDDTCNGCIYAHVGMADGDEDMVYKCRRFPGTVVFDSEDEPVQLFPDAWKRCGEYNDGKEVAMWARNHSSLNTVANVVTAVMAVLIALKLY